MALPHLRNSTAGRNLYDPAHNSIFEVRFSVPEALKDQFGADEFLLTEHLLTFTGLDALGRTTEVSQQKFMGTDRSYAQPMVDSTHAEIECKFTLNLRDNSTDNYIYKLFRAWAALNYDINTGARTLKKDYCASWVAVDIANRAGDIYHQIIFKDVMINGPIDGINDLDYSNNEALELTVKFVSDWWDEEML